MNPTQKPNTTTAALADPTPADILRCAARYLETRGWIQGNVYQPGSEEPFPAVCAAGAIGMAVYGRRTTPSDQTASDRANWRLLHRTASYLAEYLWNDGRVRECDYFGALASADHEIVSDWNDESDQTAAEVIAVLRTAANDYDRTYGAAS